MDKYLNQNKPESFSIFEKQLKKFIRKYYLIKFANNLIVFLTILILLWLLLAGINYFLYLSVKFKAILFYSTIVLSIVAFFELLVIPILKLTNLIKGLDVFEAAKLIAKLDKTFEDKLLNILHLAYNFEPNDLILASIEQKIKSLKF